MVLELDYDTQVYKRVYLMKDIEDEIKLYFIEHKCIDLKYKNIKI
jgi:hypothetical protein